MILHDWSDEGCITILRHLRAAAAPETQLVVADTVYPERTPNLAPGMPYFSDTPLLRDTANADGASSDSSVSILLGANLDRCHSLNQRADLKPHRSRADLDAVREDPGSERMADLQSSSRHRHRDEAFRPSDRRATGACMTLRCQYDHASSFRYPFSIVQRST